MQNYRAQSELDRMRRTAPKRKTAPMKKSAPQSKPKEDTEERTVSPVVETVMKPPKWYMRGEAYYHFPT